MKAQGRPKKDSQCRTRHSVYGDEEATWLLEAIGKRRGMMFYSATLRLLIYEEAARLGIRVEDLRKERETISEREPALVG